MKLIMFAIFLNSSLALAVNTNFCPSRVMTMMKIEKVYATSKYSQVPGWKQAQQDLKNASLIQITYRLVEKRNNRCLYADDSKLNTATLTTSRFLDPETNESNSSVQFILNFKTKNSEFVSYLPIDTVSVNGLKPFQNPFQLKVKAKLKPMGSQKTSDFDMGLLLVGIQ